MRSATEIAAEIAAGRARAVDIVEQALAAVAARNPVLNAFTDVTAARARAAAARVDAARAARRTLGPLAGVPYAVKNLFDIAGLPTRAGSRINRDHPPATADATLVARLENQGAILLGGLNMGEYAYDFTGENSHDGPSRNPHDVTRMTGGSSGGSGAAVAGGLVPVALGSDTNGSIRVPASLCGIFGLKPTYGRLSRAGSFPFVGSLDHLGPLARTVADLALFYDAMQGHDALDPVCADRAVAPTLHRLDDGVGGLRIAVAGGYFRQGASDQALAAVAAVAACLDARETVEIADAATARAAAYVITATEGAALHLPRLRARAADFDPDVRDRLLAGAMLPAVMVQAAQKLRSRFRAQVLALFAGGIDAVLAPATPTTAPALGQKTFMLGDAEVPVRANLGLFTQPFSFIGLPVVAVPVPSDGLPIGVQIVAAPWREDLVLRIARRLEAAGVARAPVPAGM